VGLYKPRDTPVESNHLLLHMVKNKYGWSNIKDGLITEFSREFCDRYDSHGKDHPCYTKFQETDRPEFLVTHLYDTCIEHGMRKGRLTPFSFHILEEEKATMINKPPSKPDSSSSESGVVYLPTALSDTLS
jgi:hypothetical protein